MGERKSGGRKEKAGTEEEGGKDARGLGWTLFPFSIKYLTGGFRDHMEMICVSLSDLCWCLVMSPRLRPPPSSSDHILQHALALLCAHALLLSAFTCMHVQHLCPSLHPFVC